MGKIILNVRFFFLIITDKIHIVKRGKLKRECIFNEEIKEMMLRRKKNRKANQLLLTKKRKSF